MKVTLASVYDNGGRTFDRYTAEFHDWENDSEYALVIGPTGNVPNGVCMTLDPWNGPDDECEKELSLQEVRELPRPVRKAIAGEIWFARKL